MKLIFSQNSIFHLYRLGLVVSGKMGKKYRLSNDEEMKSLIRYCTRSNDTAICRQYDAFLSSVEPSTLTQIEHITGAMFEGIRLRSVA